MSQNHLHLVTDSESTAFQLSGTGDAVRRDLTDLPFMAIDPPGAYEIDDALRVICHRSGAYTVQAAIADGSQLSDTRPLIDRAVHVGASHYQNAGQVEPMLPLPVVRKLELRTGIQKALIISQDFSAETEPSDPEIFPGWVKVQRTTYHRFGMHCRVNSKSPGPGNLVGFNRAYRLERQLGYKEAHKLRSLTEMQKFSTKMVQTYMALANMAVAKWAIQADSPLIYRKFDTSDGLWQEQQDGSVIPLRAEYTPGPAPHYGFHRFTPDEGVPYTHATSPLRRAADLVNHLLIANHLWGVELPDSINNLSGVTAHINSLAA